MVIIVKDFKTDSLLRYPTDNDSWIDLIQQLCESFGIAYEKDSVLRTYQNDKLRIELFDEYEGELIFPANINSTILRTGIKFTREEIEQNLLDIWNTYGSVEQAKIIIFMNKKIITERFLFNTK